jgi:hypothetical protein
VTSKARATPSSTRKPRAKAAPTADGCPVLAGFARLKQIEADQADELAPPESTEPLSTPAPAPSITPSEDPGPSKPTPRSSTGVLVLLIVLSVSIGLVARYSAGLLVENEAAIAVRNYAHLCDSEIVSALRARNDGKLTGEQALDIIQKARPAIHRAAWLRIAERLTALQSEAGTFDQAELNRFLDEMHSGLSSF